MNDIEKLRVLLPHWIEHNAEHADEFLTWAERARKSSEDYLGGAADALAHDHTRHHHDDSH